MPSESFQKLMLDKYIWQSCLNCEKWSRNIAARQGAPLNGPEFCGLSGTAPPADIVVNSCECWEPDIPF